jgi:hypothetical protein
MAAGPLATNEESVVVMDVSPVTTVKSAEHSQPNLSIPFGCVILLCRTCAAEARRNELNPADAAERYKRMALLAQKLKLRALAIQCHVACAVIFDECMNDEFGALAALDEAVAALGEDASGTDNSIIP